MVQNHHIVWRFVAGLICMAAVMPVFAVDPEPRQWGHLPLDRNFGTVAYLYSKADIEFNPTLQLEDVEMHLETAAARYIRTFEWQGRSSRVDVTQAYQSGKWTGLLNGVPGSTAREGLSDTFVRIAMNVVGAPPLRGKEFASYRAEIESETTIGLAMTVRLPTGYYKKDRLINLGENRFVFRPQLGMHHRRGPWSIELTGELAIYTENDEFVRNNRLERDELLFIHGHLIREFRPGQWASVSLGYDYGGENRVNGTRQDDTQKNYGWKLSYAHPITPSVGLRATYLGSRTQQNTGQDLDTLAVSLSFTW